MNSEQDSRYFESQLENLKERIADTERRLQEGLNKSERSLNDSVTNAERRVNEKLDNRDRVVEKTAEALKDKLEQMNQFRDQISQERLLYVTRDQQDLTLKSIRDQLDIVKRSIELTAGRDAGISKVWGSVAVAFSIMSAIGTGLMAMAQYLLHRVPVILLFALLALPAVAQDSVGVTTSVVPQAEGSRGGRTLSSGGPVFSQETIKTGEAGKAGIKFKDDSDLSVGAKSSVKLDKFVYGSNKTVIQVARGTFRFATGKQGVTHQISTPYGTLGIRG